MVFNFNSLCKRSFPAILLILLAGIIVYGNSLQIPFVLDDERSIIQNEVIRSLTNFYPGGKGIPYFSEYQFLPNRFVGFLTFALNYHFDGLDVTGFHLVNLFIHLAAALLVFLLLRLTFRTPYFEGGAQNQKISVPHSNSGPSLLAPHCFIPLFGALLFAIHPVQTQAVSYIVQRVTSLAAMFYLFSMVLYVKARLLIENSECRMQNAEEKTASPYLGRRAGPWLLIAGSALGSLLAMKTKEIAFTLPLAIVLYEACFFRGAWKRRLFYLLPLLATLPVIPLAVIDIGASSGELVSGTEQQLRVGTDISRLDYLLTQFRVLVTYLRLLILPVNQNLDYDYPVYTSFFTPPVFLSFLLLAAIFSLGIYFFYVSRVKPQSESLSRPQSAFPSACLRLIAFGIFWFFLTLSVESSLIPIVDVIMEHRLYLPGFGAAAAFAAAFWLIGEKMSGSAATKLFFFSAVVLLLVLGIATYQRNHVWGNTIRLWQDAVAKSPNKGRPINNLGVALEDAGRRSEALNTLYQAIRVDPGYYKTYYNLANLYLVSDQPDEALRLLQTAIRLKPDFIEAYVKMGAALMRGGRFREIIIFLQQNFDRIRENGEARFYLGAAHAFLGNREAAMRELEVVSRLDPALAADLAGLLGLRTNRRIPQGAQ